ncbi:MAG: stalk domain-containing protein [Peptoniphilus sp.]|nr:stalk domain-containing protein [Peptoniphilus sp.]MDY3118403.1 stalk domain-containing protein [Peptoniphilus sp.]
MADAITNVILREREVLPLTVGMKAADHQKEGAVEERKKGYSVIDAMLSEKPGADPLTIAAASDKYIVLEHYCGLLILDRNFLEPVAEISGKDIGLTTQGDAVFSYSLDGDTLHLKRMGEGKSFAFAIEDGILREEKGEDPLNTADVPNALSEKRVEEILGSERQGQGVEGDHWIVALAVDWNQLGNSQLVAVDKNTGEKRVKNLQDLAETKPSVSIFSDEKPLNAKGFVEKGTAYLPLRAIMEGQGDEVKWNPKDSTIRIKGKDREISLVLEGEKYCVKKDGKNVRYDFYVRGDGTYLTQKFFKEMAGLTFAVDKK